MMHVAIKKQDRDVVWHPSTWYKHDTVTNDTHDTDGVWCLLPDTNMTLPHVTHMLQVVSDRFSLIKTWYKLCDTHDTGGVWSLLPDTNMIQAMWHTWYRWCLMPSTWYKHDSSFVTQMIQKLCDTNSTWYNHDTARCDTYDTGGVWCLPPDTNMTLPYVTHILQTWTHLNREVIQWSLGLVFLWFKYIYLVWLPIISCLAFTVSWQLHCKKSLQLTVK